jgi:hypothetical protein
MKLMNIRMKKATTSTDTKELRMILTNFVHHDQYQLRIEIERRRDQLKIDANDHRLIPRFH